MGEDKALVAIDGVTLLERTTRVFESITDDVRLACGPVPRYTELGLELVLDRAPDLGPLGGLEAALADGRAELVVATACDMPRLEAALFESLLAQARSERLDACIVRSARGNEPLCGVWRATMLAPIRAALARGERRVVAAFDEELAAGGRPRVGYLALADVEHVRNLNTPADLAAERKR
jgi:molybdopterin-guanine dinucleotide biosynthesis protein A